MTELARCKLCGSEPNTATRGDMNLSRCESDDCPMGALEMPWLSYACWQTLMADERVEEVDIYRAKQLCTHFFYWWYNQPGTNTDQGFDAWMETDEAKRIVQPTGEESKL